MPRQSNGRSRGVMTEVINQRLTWARKQAVIEMARRETERRGKLVTQLDVLFENALQHNAELAGLVKEYEKQQRQQASH